jgi:hypothetical protein
MWFLSQARRLDGLHRVSPVPFRSMLLTPLSVQWSLAPKAHRPLVWAVEISSHSITTPRGAPSVQLTLGASLADLVNLQDYNLNRSHSLRNIHGI